MTSSIEKRPTSLKAPLAVIDLGSNTFHLAITSLDDAGQIHVVDSLKETLRLAETADEQEIPEKFFKRAKDALLAMKGIGQSYHAEFRLVATQAVRSARNRIAFIEQVQESTGLKLELIDGVEEARLSFLGVIQALSFGQDNLLMVDIGGASTEIAVGRGASCHYLSSLKMGALVASKKFLEGDPAHPEMIHELKEWIESRIGPIEDDLSGMPIDHAVATSGTAKAIARMIHWDNTRNVLEDPHGFRFQVKDLYKLEHELTKIFSPEKIAQRWGIEFRRAEIILAGVSILASLSKILKISQWTVSTSGLREGVAIDTYTRKGLLPMTHWQDLRWQSIRAFANKLRLDLEFAQKMCSLAVQVFDSLLQYPEFSIMLQDHQIDRELLRDAAFLIESGKFVSFSAYHRHSYYLIAESNLLGFTQEEKNIIALTNRFSRKNPPKNNKTELLPYLERNLSRINLLSSCLRISRSLLRTRQLKIRSVEIQRRGGVYTIVATSMPGFRLEAERLSLKKEIKNLEKSLDQNFDCSITTREKI